MSAERKMLVFEIATEGSVKKLSDSKFLVQSKNGRHVVRRMRQGWGCDCSVYDKTGGICEHIYAVIYWQFAQSVMTVCRELTHPFCPYCGSYDVTRAGMRYTNLGSVQRYVCKKCRRKFTDRTPCGIENLASAIASAVDLYFRGMSMRKISHNLENEFGVSVSHVTVRNWVAKYKKVVDSILKRLKLWHAETMRFENGYSLIWNFLDSESRVLLGAYISKYRGFKEALNNLKIQDEPEA